MRYKPLLLAVFIMQTGIPSSARAQDAMALLSVTVNGIEDGKSIPNKFASCVADGNGATRKGKNISPAISWSGAPAAAKSYAVIVVDKDVPANFESANKAGKMIAADAPRKDFYHWVLIDIPATTTNLPENAKPPGIIGRNDMGTKSKSTNGYDGPCPPWNDDRLHYYHFQVYALDISSLGLKTPFTGKQAEDAIKGHILTKGEVIGAYATNPKLHKSSGQK